MKERFLAALAVAASVASPVMAADQHFKAPVKAPPAVFSWTGCYFGGNGGWIGGRDRLQLAPGGNYLLAPGAGPPPNLAGTGDFPADIAALTHSYGIDNSSYEAGVQVGCNQQFGTGVVGFEADWQASNLSNAVDSSYAAFPDAGNALFTVPAHTEHVTSKLDWFSTFRGRIGFTPVNGVLLYGTAGFVVADLSSDTTVSFATGPAFAVYSGALHVGSSRKTPFGPVVGAGAEWAFASGWSAKAEVLYFELNDDALSYQSPLVSAVPAFAPGYAWNTRITMREVVARAGINYHFGFIAP